MCRFIYKNDEGSVLGPFAPLLNSPGLCKPYCELFKAMSQIPGLTPKARETVILATGSHYKAAYEIYAHERLALKNTELTKEQINLIKNGQKPKDLDKGSSVAFDAAIELVAKPGPLKKESWDAVVKELGRKDALALVHFVGMYAYTCILLNGCDVPLPEGENIM